MTTRRGDVLIHSIGGHYGKYRALDLLSDAETTQREEDFTARKLHLMSQNADTIKNTWTLTACCFATWPCARGWRW